MLCLGSVTTAYTIKLQPALTLTDDQFYQLCITNPDLKLERNAQGDLLIMSPTVGETGNRNVELATEFVLWNRQHRLGVVFVSSTGLKLPGGGERSPRSCLDRAISLGCLYA
ncbi:Uma2 family endonuclease [Leptolyngbya subtilissima]|uniref:Uma2 family endonuclease n=1 Tax=Leptolyngbya subtilissima TaxID=1346803 RepID=UPI003D64EE86